MTQISWQWNPIVPADHFAQSERPAPRAGEPPCRSTGPGFTTGETVNFTSNPKSSPRPTPTTPPLRGRLPTATPSCPATTCIQVTAPGHHSRQRLLRDGHDSGRYEPDGAQRLHELRADLHLQPSGADSQRADGKQPRARSPATRSSRFRAPASGTPPRTRSLRRLSSVRPGPRRSGEQGRARVGHYAASVVNIIPPPANSTTFTMTALTPAVSAAGSYFVQVEVFNVYSTQTSATFTYSVQVPLIVSLNPLNGATGNPTDDHGCELPDRLHRCLLPDRQIQLHQLLLHGDGDCSDRLRPRPATTRPRSSSASPQWRRAPTTRSSRCPPRYNAIPCVAAVQPACRHLHPHLAVGGMLGLEHVPPDLPFGD